jgi:flagellar protein FlaG
MQMAGSRPQEAEVKPVRSADAPEGAESADLRLIIEEAGEPGHYVYTIVDRRTGKIVSQLPRDQILRLREEPDYSAGAVFDGKA